MAMRILFVSGSLGLGHIGRDLAIARELRRQNGSLEIDWLAAPPADRVLRDAGENLLPEARELGDENAVAESHANGGGLSLFRYLLGAQDNWRQNVSVVQRVASGGDYDLLVGDETYELITAYKRGKARKPLPFVMIYDFIGMDAMGWNPMERLGTYLWNRSWSRGGNDPSANSSIVDLSLFIGEEEDVPDRPFGPFLPNRREWARGRCEFVGYILSFDPEDYQDRRALRRQLGYDPDLPLVICSIGGTAIGRGLLELCGRAYRVATDRIPDLQMVLVAGPRLDPDTLDVPDGVTRRGYVPRLYEHLAAGDLAVVQGGGTLTLELTALGRPFLYFPIPGHCEQQVHVAGRLRRHRAGVGMDPLNTSPEELAEAMVRNLGGEADTGHVPVEGARVAAEKISRLL